MMGDVLAGASMGMQFNVVAATVTAVVAAAIAGYPGAPRARAWWAAGVLAIGWALGDGLALVAASGGASALYEASWALVGLAIGYCAPAVAGTLVGRAVFRGTGWLAAGAVALAVAPALSAISQRVAPAVWAVAR